MAKYSLSQLIASPIYAPKSRYSAKKLQWIMLLCFSVVMVIEAFSLPDYSTSEQEELQATQYMQNAMQKLASYRTELGIAFDPALDPNLTGLIGVEYSDLTTTQGALVAKRTSTNPAFAGAIVRMLHKAGIKKGDNIAVSMSGSFPALNIATLAACQAMNLQLQIISSVGSSTYGANIPGFSWLDMETYLYQQKIFPYRSIAVSFGGIVETHGGIDGTGFILAQDAVDKHGATFLVEGDYRSVEQDLLHRKKLFEQQGNIAAFINVGGSLTSLGWTVESAKLDSGLLTRVPNNNSKDRGLIFRYAEEGVPVIHLLNIVRLAEHYALPVDPIPLPAEDEYIASKRFIKRYILCFVVLLLWMFSCFCFLRVDNDSISPDHR